MKAKRLTALALAALMAASTTSVALAAPGDVDKDQALNFYAGAVGDDLYMMDEDGYIRAAVDGDFAPGDDIYLALKEYPSASSTELKRMNVYADWAVGKSWVDDVEIVYKKGQWKTDVAQSKNYVTSGFSTPYDDLNGVAFSSNKTEAASLKAAAIAALKSDAAASKRSDAARSVLDSYKHVSGGYRYNGKYYSSQEEMVKDLFTEVGVYYVIDGNTYSKNYDGYERKIGGYKKGTQYFVDWSELMADASSSWVKYNPDVHAEKYVVTSGTGYVTYDDSSVGTKVSEWLTTNGLTDDNTIYVNESLKKIIVVSKMSGSDLVSHLNNGGSTYTAVNENEAVFYTNSSNDGITTIHTVANVVEKKDGWFNGNEFVGANVNDAASTLSGVESGVEYYVVGNEYKTPAEAQALAEASVNEAINKAGYTTASTFSGNPTGSYDGYNTESGYAYWVKISTKESTGTKDIDLVGDISIGRTKTSAKGNEVTLGVTLTNQNNQNAGDYTDVDSDVYIEPGERAVVSFADDAGDVVVEFGDDAWFEFNARGQGKLNLAYNTKFNKDFAYDYDDANIDFINFEGEPTTNRTGTLYIYADEDSYIYEVTSKGAKKINGAYYDDDEEAWVIRTRNLTSYAISDKKLKTVDQMNNGSSSSSSSKPGSNSGSGSNNGKPNPDTGR